MLREERRYAVSNIKRAVSVIISAEDNKRYNNAAMREGERWGL